MVRYDDLMSWLQRKGVLTTSTLIVIIIVVIETHELVIFGDHLLGLFLSGSSFPSKHFGVLVIVPS
jgi:hypothetical protein